MLWEKAKHKWPHRSTRLTQSSSIFIGTTHATHKLRSREGPLSQCLHTYQYLYWNTNLPSGFLHCWPQSGLRCNTHSQQQKKSSTHWGLFAKNFSKQKQKCNLLQPVRFQHWQPTLYWILGQLLLGQRRQILVTHTAILGPCINGWQCPQKERMLQAHLHAPLTGIYWLQERQHTSAMQGTIHQDVFYTWPCCWEKIKQTRR